MKILIFISCLHLWIHFCGVTFEQNIYYIFSETYLYTKFIGILIQTSFGYSNGNKVGQLTKELEKNWVDEKNC